MSTPSIHQLLGLPSDVTHPNAYQVFGLALGEADQQVIRTAIERRILSIKQAKSASEPDVWMQAVRAVQAAQKVLVDPEQKAALDAKYGILNEPEPHPSASPSIPALAADPLAALLPSSHSTAGATPTAPTAPTAPADSAPAQQPTGSPPSAEMPPSAPAATTLASTQASRVQVSDHRRVRRRRGSGGVIFRSIAVLMLGVLVAGLAYLFISGGNVQLVKSDEGFQVNSGSTAARPSGARVAAAQARSQDSRGDGIMKPSPAVPSPGTRSTDDPAKTRESNSSPDREDAMDAPPMTPTKPAPDKPAPDTPAMDAEMGDTETTGTETMPASPAPSTPPGPDQIPAGESALKTARDAIIAADWANMKSLCETAEKKAVTDEQKQAAETLYQFADMAVHYRSALQKSMSELVAGNEFKLTDSLTFLVQKSSAQQITLYRNKREYSYSLDDLPLSVAHALAPFGMNVSSPEGQAAEAVFQVISPMTTAGHRAQSIEILRGLESVPGADPQKLADFIASLGAP